MGSIEDAYRDESRGIAGGGYLIPARSASTVIVRQDGGDLRLELIVERWHGTVVTHPLTVNVPCTPCSKIWTKGRLEPFTQRGARLQMLDVDGSSAPQQASPTWIY